MEIWAQPLSLICWVSLRAFHGNRTPERKEENRLIYDSQRGKKKMCYFNLFALTPYNRKILLFSLLLFFPFMEDPTVTTPLYEPPEAITGRRLPDEHKFKCDIWAIVRWQSILSLLFPLFFRTFVSLFPPSSLYPSLSLLLTFSLYSLSFVSSLSASPYRLQHFFLHYGARFFFRAAFLWKWQTGLLTHTLVLDIIYFK